ncbi:SEC14-like protein 5 isoform X2 [Dysidea avara]|uniref:SEC14-like protein 5 isoform X2 n=1 Tax=Dysidea avara TaxID=196820 RepID=UPI00331721CB
MVKSYQAPTRVYEHTFEFCMKAYDLRFPTCKLVPQVLASDIVFEEWSDDRSRHTVERRCTLDIDAPYILKKITGQEVMYFVQRNELDLKARVLKIKAWNESFSNRLCLRETCSYQVHSENPEWTSFDLHASLEVKSFFGFEGLVEKIAIKLYSGNLHKGREVMEYCIKTLHSEGITAIPKWGEGHPNEITRSVQEQEVGVTLERSDSESSWASAEDDEITKIPLPAMSSKEEGLLLQLKQRVQAVLKEEQVPDDLVLWRFLKARDNNVVKARDMLLHSLAWRKQYQIDRLLAWKPPQILKDYFIAGWHQTDNAGRPVFIWRLGETDIKGLLKAGGESAMLKYVIFMFEDAMKRLSQASSQSGTAVYMCTVICDLEGVSMRHLWRPALSALARLSEVIIANYPETVAHMLVVRAPRVFPLLWQLVSCFFDPNTRKKIIVYGGNDYQDTGGLRDYITPECIPDFLGGSCQSQLPKPGLVPKELYGSCEHSDEDWGLDALYQRATVTKGSPHEMMVKVTEPNSFIAWEFDVIIGEVLFCLLRAKSADATAATASASKVSIVLEPHNHREGESIQGSFECPEAGTYYLQWTVTATSPISPGGKSRNKATIMHYQEVIGCEEFKGSMSSLASCQSALSSLSVNDSTATMPTNFSTTV